MSNTLKSGRYYISASELAYIASIASDAPQLYNFWQKIAGHSKKASLDTPMNSALPKGVQLSLADLAYSKMRNGEELTMEEQQALTDSFISETQSSAQLSAGLSVEDI